MRVFVSYRRSDDRSLAGRLYDRLAGHFGATNVFFDVASISPGQDFRHVLTATLESSDVVLALIGDRWDADRLRDPDDFVRYELEEAFRQRKLVVPVLLGDRVEMPSEQDLPAALASLRFINAQRLRSDPDFHRDVAELIAGIQRTLGTIGDPERGALEEIQPGEGATEPQPMAASHRRGAILLLISVASALVIAMWAARGDDGVAERQARGDMIGVTGGRADDFRIALTEVTNHQYRLCTSQGPCEEPNSIASSESPFDNATFDGYAVVGVNALQAREFCQWVGADLPTFEQWQDAVARYASLEWPMSSGGMEIVRPEVGQEPWEQPFPRPVVDTERSNSGGRPSYLIGLNQEWTRSECDEFKCQAWPASDRRPHGDLRVVGIADPYATSSEKYALGSTSWFVDVRFDLVNPDIQETYVSFRCVTA